MTTILEHFGVAWNVLKPELRVKLLQGNSDLDDINTFKLWEDFGKRQKLRIFRWCNTGLTDKELRQIEKEMIQHSKTRVRPHNR